MYAEFQSVNHVEVLKVVGNFWFFIPVNDMKDLKSLSYWYLHWSVIPQADIEEVYVDSQ